MTSIEVITEDSNSKLKSKLQNKPSSKNKYLFFEEIYLAFKDWSLVSSAQCLPKVFQSENKCNKIVWLSLFLSFTFITFWFFVNGILDYLEYDVVSKIRVYSEDFLVYPIITFCHADQFPSKEAVKLFEDLEQENFNIFEMFTEIMLNNSFKDNNFQNYSAKAIYYINSRMNKSYYMDDNGKRSLSHDLKDIIQFCQFNSIPCLQSDFSWFFSYMYGNCFQFNSKENVRKSIKSGGLGNGLMLTIKNLTNFNKYSFGDGLRVFVHNSTFFPSSADQILVETGKTTNIQIKKTFTYREQFPYSQCQDLSNFKSGIFDYIKRSNGLYRQNDCIELCYQHNIINDCKCFLTYLPVFKNISYGPCVGKSQMQCVFKQYINNRTLFEKKCALECPLECYYVTYDLSSSSLNYPSKAFYNEFKKMFNEYENMTLEEYKETNLMIYVFLQSKEYTVIREIPKISIVDLISLLGGVLGIFLGFSIFTFIEIFEFLFKVIFLLIKRF